MSTAREIQFIENVKNVKTNKGRQVRNPWLVGGKLVGLESEESFIRTECS